jgi:hypothetical protein
VIGMGFRLRYIIQTTMYEVDIVFRLEKRSEDEGLIDCAEHVDTCELDLDTGEG